MEFDLAIVPKRGREDWNDVLARVEEGARDVEPLSPNQASVWDRVVERLNQEDAFEMLRNDERIELTLDESGIQVEMFERGVVIHCSNDGDTVTQAIDATNRIVATITEETGWTAYDPTRGLEVASVDHLGPSTDIAGRARRAIDRDRLVHRPEPVWWRFWEKR